jgi:hypothetical protein
VSDLAALYRDTPEGDLLDHLERQYEEGEPLDPGMVFEVLNRVVMEGQRFRQALDVIAASGSARARDIAERALGGQDIPTADVNIVPGISLEEVEEVVGAVEAGVPSVDDPHIAAMRVATFLLGRRRQEKVMANRELDAVQAEVTTLRAELWRPWALIACLVVLNLLLVGTVMMMAALSGVFDG